MLPPMDGDVEIIPLLMCSDVAAEHDFLVAAFGFESAFIEHDPDGTAFHAEVRAGRRRIWLHRVEEDEHLVSPRMAGSAGGGIVVHVPDVDAHHERARAAGAEVVDEPADQDYGQREYGVRDPEGHLWWVATPTRPPAQAR